MARVRVESLISVVIGLGVGVPLTWVRARLGLVCRGTFHMFVGFFFLSLARSRKHLRRQIGKCEHIT